jgi:hypothetical protein
MFTQEVGKARVNYCTEHNICMFQLGYQTLHSKQLNHLMWVVHVQVLAFLKPPSCQLFTKDDNEEFPRTFFWL